MATATRTKPKTYHQIFMDRTRSIHSGMVQRFAEKRNKLNRVTRIGRQVPFTVDQLRDKVRTFLDGREDGVARCQYCDVQITAGTLGADHAIPVNRGGSLALENIEFPCQPCNARKGQLLPEEYAALYRALKAWPIVARQDVLHRLEIAVQLAAQRRFGLSSKAKKTQEETAE